MERRVSRERLRVHGFGFWGLGVDGLGMACVVLQVLVPGKSLEPIPHQPEHFPIEVATTVTVEIVC